MKMEMTPQDDALVKKTLQGAGFLEHLSTDEYRRLFKAFEKVGIVKGEELINQGTVGKVFYLLAQGRVGVYRQRQIMDIELAQLGPGSFFGEMSLMTNSKREATVKALEDGIVFTLFQDSFNDIIMRNPNIAYMLRKVVKDREKATADLEMQERMKRLKDAK